MDHLNSIVILQHNTLHWETNKFNLTNTYLQINPDIILLNSHGVKTHDSLYIKGYTTYRKNNTNQKYDGSAVLIKSHIKHRIIDDFITDVIELRIETPLGTLSIATTYLPPRRPYLPFPDIHKLLHNNHPTYIIGDLNAKHRLLGNTYNNTVGNGLATFINRGKAIHLGPNFPTFFTNNMSTPDIVISNNKAIHNILINPGPITSSDHLPVIVKLTSTAITTPIPSSYNMWKADWSNVKKEIQGKMNEVQLDSHVDKSLIEKKLNQWYNIIEGIINNVPKKTKLTTHKPITSPTLRHLQHRFIQLHLQAQIVGWNIPSYYTYKTVQNKIKEESEKSRDNNYTKSLETLIQNYKQPQKVWQQIKKNLKATHSPQNQHLVKDNLKITGDKDKEKAFRGIWKTIFSNYTGRECTL